MTQRALVSDRTHTSARRAIRLTCAARVESVFDHELVVCDIKKYALEVTEHGKLKIWVLGKAGWYAIKPSTEYTAIFTEVEEKARLWLFIETFVAAKRKSKYSFRQFLNEYRAEVPGAQEAHMSKYMRFLLVRLVNWRNDEERKSWEKTCLYRWYAEQHPDEVATVKALVRKVWEKVDKAEIQMQKKKEETPTPKSKRRKIRSRAVDDDSEVPSTPIRPATTGKLRGSSVKYGGKRKLDNSGDGSTLSLAQESQEEPNPGTDSTEASVKCGGKRKLDNSGDESTLSLAQESQEGSNLDMDLTEVISSTGCDNSQTHDLEEEEHSYHSPYWDESEDSTQAAPEMSGISPKVPGIIPEVPVVHSLSSVGGSGYVSDSQPFYDRFSSIRRMKREQSRELKPWPDHPWMHRSASDEITSFALPALPISGCREAVSISLLDTKTLVGGVWKCPLRGCDHCVLDGDTPEGVADIENHYIWHQRSIWKRLERAEETPIFYSWKTKEYVSPIYLDFA